MTARGILLSRRGFIAAGTAAMAAPVFIRNARAQDKFVMKIAHTATAPLVIACMSSSLRLKGA